MNCPNCGRENTIEAAYCIGCGTALSSTCPSCGAKATPDAAYCAACGSPLRPENSRMVLGAVQALKCSRCGEVNERSAVYCAACGFPLREEEPVRFGSPSVANDTLDAWELGRPAGFWIRVVASLIDGLVLMFAVAIIAAIIIQENYIGSRASEEAGFTSQDTLTFLTVAAYLVAMVAVYAATVGKLALGIRIVRTDGSKVNWGTAVLRFLASVLSMLLLGIGFLMVAFRDDKRALHDLMCGTVVIIKRH